MCEREDDITESLTYVGVCEGEDDITEPLTYVGAWEGEGYILYGVHIGMTFVTHAWLIVLT